MRGFCCPAPLGPRYTLEFRSPQLGSGLNCYERIVVSCNVLNIVVGMYKTIHYGGIIPGKNHSLYYVCRS